MERKKRIEVVAVRKRKSEIGVWEGIAINGCDKDAANLISTNREGGGSPSRASQHRRQLQQSRQRHSQARRRRLARLLLQRHRRRYQQLRRYGSDLSLFFLSPILRAFLFPFPFLFFSLSKLDLLVEHQFRLVCSKIFFEEKLKIPRHIELG